MSLTEALHALFAGPRFAYIPTTDRNELVAGIVGLIGSTLDAAGHVQQDYAGLTARVLNLADLAGLVIEPQTPVDGVVDALEDYVDDVNNAEDTIRVGTAENEVASDNVCPHERSELTNAGKRYCRDCLSIITPAAAPTPVPATPGPSDPA